MTTEPVWSENQLSKEQAVAFFDSKAWEQMTDRQIVELQLFTERLCIPFGRFHQAIEAVLGRSVWTHEFVLNLVGIQQEFLGNRKPPTMAEIIELIPEDKRIVIIGG